MVPIIRDTRIDTDHDSCTGFTLTLQETRCVHDCLNRLKLKFITYTYILYYQSSINFQTFCGVPWVETSTGPGGFIICVFII